MPGQAESTITAYQRMNHASSEPCGCTAFSNAVTTLKLVVPDRR